MGNPRAFVNWARTHQSLATNYFQPTSEEEIAELIVKAKSDGKKIRIVGAGHSWSSIVCTSEWLINLDRLNAFINIDGDSKQITVQAGMRLKELNEILDLNELALQNLGSISEQSVAGVISTATHGSSVNHGIMATQVLSLTFIDGNGEIHKITAADGDLWRARVSLGSLGIITEVTLQCCQAFDLKEYAYPLSLDEMDATMLEQARTNEYFKMWWFPHVDVAQAYTYNTTNEARMNHDGIMRWIDDNFLAKYVFSLILAIGKAWPSLVPYINRFVKFLKFHEERRIDRSDRVLTLPMPPIHNEIEWAIAMEDAPAAFQQVRAMIEERNLKINFIIEIRFVKADDCMLSPCHSRDSAYIGGYHAGEEGWKEYVEGFEEIMLKFNGRPHWGKHFTVDKKAIKSMYPELSKFNEIRSKLDPDKIFVNDFIQNTIIQ